MGDMMGWTQIDENYERVKADPISGDVSGHMDTLREYAAGKRVVEFGVYDGTTTWALLAGHPVWMRSYDKARRHELHYLCACTSPQEPTVDWAFIEGDTLQIEIEPCDVLYIDTLHTYAQLTAELDRHAAKVGQYIICHDTVTFGAVDQTGKPPGLWNAIEDWLARTPSWRLKHHYLHCNGLAVLERIDTGAPSGDAKLQQTH